MNQLSGLVNQLCIFKNFFFPLQNCLFVSLSLSKEMLKGETQKGNFVRVTLEDNQ